MGTEYEWGVVKGERKLIQVEHHGYFIDLFDGLRVCLC